MKTEKIARTLNFGAFILALWLFFYPKPYLFLLLLAISLPVFSIVFLRLSKGKYKILETDKNEARPSLIYSIIWPCLALIIRVYEDFTVFNTLEAVIVGSVSTFVILFILLIKNKAFESRKTYDWLTLIILFGLFFMHGYCTSIVANCELDRSEASIYHARLLHKNISYGKGEKSYCFGLSAWGPFANENEILVSKDVFKRAEIRDEVTLFYRKGKLNMPWVKLELARYDYNKPRPR